MASDNQITIVGNLTDDPELRYTSNGAAVANFRVAYSTRIRDAAGNWTDGETSFFTVNCWRALAENAAETLTRGRAWWSPGASSNAPGRTKRARSAPSSRSRPTTSVPA